MPSKDVPPSLFQYDCVNCLNLFWVLLYQSDTGPALAIFPAQSGGISTKNTPLTVSYYVDQGYRAQLVGAYSAAMGMYRSALEQLLQDKQYSGTLPDMLDQLENAIKVGKVIRINADILKLLKDIAKSHMHPNVDGDQNVSKSGAIVMY